MRTLAAIDIGTVSTRLIVARVSPAGSVEPLERQATITDLGEGVDAAGRLSGEAIARTCDVVAGYLRAIRSWAERGERVEAVAAAATSASRDAENAGEFLDAMRGMGLAPQVIAGGVEARLALLGVTGDFAGQRVLVADIGGGSTELTVGGRAGDGGLEVGASVSYDVGCRRVAERFFDGGAPAASPDAIRAARSFVSGELGRFSAEAGGALPPTLVCVGGTATSLVSVANRLVPYDSSFVHLHRTARAEVGGLAERLLAMTSEERAALPGLQPKRASVIASGALILDELMGLGGWDAYVASEADSLFGMLLCMDAELGGGPSPIGWAPAVSFFRAGQLC